MSSNYKKPKSKTKTRTCISTVQDSSISEDVTHNTLKETFSNLSKTVKDRLIVWNCCFCPGLKTIDCCNSCEVDTHLGV